MAKMLPGAVEFAGGVQIAVRDTAGNTVLKVVRTRMDLLGLAAPRKSMSLQASMELDSENESLQAQLAEAYARPWRRRNASSPTSAPTWPGRRIPGLRR